MLNAIPVVFFLYAAALMGGGAMGFKVANSVQSLVGSALFGIVAIVAGVLTRKTPNVGLILGIVDALGVIALFIYRYQKTGKPFPAFPSIGMSVVVIICAAIAYAAIPKAGR